MSRQIVAIPELWTDGIQPSGVTRDVSFHMLVRFRDDETGEVYEEWHYYGTEAPPASADGVNVVQHPVIHFPTDFLNIADGDSGILYDVALTVPLNMLQR